MGRELNINSTSDNVPEEAADIGRREWLLVARRELIRGGISEVRISHLAKLRGTTRGGFYWHFKNREDLLSSLLTDWEITNTSAFLEALRGDGSPFERLSRLNEVWIDESEYDPAYDEAIREWARKSKAARAAIQRVDSQRISAITNVMSMIGYSPEESLVRARVAYYTYVGFYAARARLPKEVRRKNTSLFIQILTGLRDDGTSPSKVS